MMGAFRVGVYIDGYNLYYGGNRLVGDGRWKWLDVRVTHERNEEKRSDVNLASHLLIDLFMESIDAAIIVSNDADLSFPIKFARTRIPVGVINPWGTQTVGDLKGNVTDGVGSQWWYRLTADDLLAHQLPETIGHLYRPTAWR